MSAAASAVASCATPRTARYQRRRPEQTLWYRIVQTHFATWLDLASGEFGAAPPGYVERTFRRYLECGILAHGFARAYCDTCQHDFLIAYSCKGRGVCPSRPTGISFGHNTRRMAETAAHFVDHVFPPLPVRQLLAAKRYPKHAELWCWRCPSGCAIFCRPMQRCRARCCGFF